MDVSLWEGVAIIVGSALVVTVLDVWWGMLRKRRAEKYNEQVAAHQRQLLESMREEAAARAAFEGVDFVLMPCVCGGGEEMIDTAIDCPRCDDTGFVEVVV